MDRVLNFYCVKIDYEYAFLLLLLLHFSRGQFKLLVVVKNKEWQLRVLWSKRAECCCWTS